MPALNDQSIASAADGEVRVGPIPRSAGAAIRHFHLLADAIVDGWLEQRDKQVRTESAHSWCKRNLYRLIKSYVDRGQGDVFRTMAHRSGRSLVGIDAIGSNPFKLALFAMWSDNVSMTRHQQRVWGNQMMYANLHDVPPEHLIGFIGSAGSAQRIAEKLAAGSREPGF